ncbi:MAG: homocysteine S-methyltransferase family protein [Pirellulales bacterium]|nr:homocysteine S-methyltransferase family protein [Pirellulales bacterium]
MLHWMDELVKSGPIVTDGAWGTQLQALGLPSGECPDLWNLVHPELVERVPRSYVEAGSQVVLTNTFRANRIALADYGLADQVAAINQAGGEISRRAAGNEASVFGSIGPCGKMLFAGQVAEEELRAAFTEQAQALADSGVDGLVIETMADVDEAVIALLAAKATGLPVVACTVYDSGKDKDRIMTGKTPEAVAQELTAAGADVIGANCGQGIASYVSICRRLRGATDRPIWIKANAGVPQVVGDQVVYGSSAEQFAEHVPELVAAGASFIGGCCGTNPDFIRALRHRIGR